VINISLIAIEEYYLYGAVAFAVLMLIASIMIVMTIRNNAPDAFSHWKASRTGQPICRIHYKGRKAVDHIATIEKSEKEVGTNYWTVPSLGLKFKPEPESIEFIEGSIPCVNYYENMPEGLKMHEVVAFSQLKDYFKKIGIPIEGIEDIAFYVSAENEKVTDKNRAINNAKIDSAETRHIIKRYLETIEEHKPELKSIQLASGVFTWQTAMKALDSTIAYTSSHLGHTKETIRAAIMRQEENKRKDYIMYAIVGFILCIGAAALIVVTQK